MLSITSVINMIINYGVNKEKNSDTYKHYREVHLNKLTVYQIPGQFVGGTRHKLYGRTLSRNRLLNSWVLRTYERTHAIEDFRTYGDFSFCNSRQTFMEENVFINTSPYFCL